MVRQNTVESCMDTLDNFLSVNENEKIDTALLKLKETMNRGGGCRGARLLIAINNTGEPTGIFTVKSVLGAAAFRMLKEDIDFKSECFSWHYVNKMSETGITVREVMRPLYLHTVERGKSTAHAARIIVKHGINFLPVTDRKKVIGILSSRDLFYQHYELTHFDPIYQYTTKKGSRLLKEPATI